VPVFETRLGARYLAPLRRTTAESPRRRRGFRERPAIRAINRPGRDDPDAWTFGVDYLLATLCRPRHAPTWRRRPDRRARELRRLAIGDVVEVQTTGIGRLTPPSSRCRGRRTPRASADRCHRRAGGRVECIAPIRRQSLRNPAYQALGDAGQPDTAVTDTA